MLSLGARGVDVATVQRLLTHGGEPVAITALVGPTTEGLIRRFQARKGLAADGVVGPATWRALQPTLRAGDTGVAVQAVQAALNEKFGNALVIDGQFGPRTEAAVRRMQAHMGLTVDGVVGPNTWTALVSHFDALAAAGPGWYRYDTGNPGNYGTANTIALVEDISWQWRTRGNQARLGIGDISLKHGGPMPGHASHRRGVDVDVLIMRNDGREAEADFRDVEYSRELTQELVNLFLATGEVDVILFNDPGVRGVVPWPGHDRHMHIRFKR